MFHKILLAFDSADGPHKALETAVELARLWRADLWVLVVEKHPPRYPATVEMASPLGISEGYVPLVEALAGELARLVEYPVAQATASLAALLADATTCAACRLVRETAGEQIKHVLARLITAEGREDYSSSAELCLPHLHATLAYMGHGTDEASEYGEIARFLLSEQAQRLEDLAEDLHSYALKRDALRRGLLHQEEAEAWRRTLVLLVGERAARGGAMMGDSRTV
jgi:hypothetical protein